MAEQHDTDRWREIRTVHKENANFYRMLRGGIIIGLFVFIGWSVFQQNDEPRAFGLNLWTEIAGIAVTVLIIDERNRQRAEEQRKVRLADSERQALLQYQRQLIDEAASTSSEIAKHAVHVLQRKGWIAGEKGLLKGQDLRRARLSKAELTKANLQQTNLSMARLMNASMYAAELQGASLSDACLKNAKLVQAKLQNARLERADLTDAWLTGADMRMTDLFFAVLQNAAMQGVTLQDAKLDATDLRGANLQYADLKNAFLIGANLQGADLTEANLEGVKVSANAKCDASTILPNKETWTPSVDWEYFTNPARKDFWRSHDSESPAFDEKYRNLVISIED